MSRTPVPEATSRPDCAVLWHPLSVEDAACRLETDLARGLTEESAKDRLARYGYNRIEEAKPTPAWRIFLGQFSDVLIIILIVAAVISGVVLREWIDAAAIAAILLLNAILGFVQEYRAERALAALKKLVAPHAQVVRSGEVREVTAEQLVPGDIVMLEAGNRVPADLRICEAHLLAADESALTGESVPVEKHARTLAASVSALGDRTNLAFSGTTITRGRGRGLVTATGSSTEMGAIVKLVETEKERTPLQNELTRLGVRIGYVCLGVSVVVLVSGLLRGHELAYMFLTAISLAVAAIPEGLPTAVTVALALGVKRMVAKNALVRRLHAVETLGSTSVICSDKTGTITVNRMQVERLAWQEQVIEIAQARHRRHELNNLLEGYVLCNDVHKDQAGRTLGDPLEVGLLVAAEEAGVDPDRLRRELPRVAEVPFDADRKAMSTIHRRGAGYRVLVKGAPEAIARICRPEPGPGWVRINQDLTGKGYRTLAFAVKDIPELPDPVTPETIEHSLTFLGLAALSDPPREEVAHAIRTCRQAGIRVAMVTGDHVLTARNIAQGVGLLDNVPAAEIDRQVVGGPELDAMSDEDLARQVDDLRVYARVSPLQKVKIVKALRRKGHIVAMTGDGVNDAPALKLADIGVSMGVTGTDVAREAADMVLLDDNFATIVAAVREGRMIYANIRKFIYFLLSCNMGEVISVLFASLAGLPIPAPIQILWMNLVTDGPPALALGVDPPDSGLMDRPPRNPKDSILGGRNLVQLIVQGVILTLGVVAVYLLAPRFGGRTEEEVRTAVFFAMVLGQKFHVFNFRVGNRFYFSRPLFANRYLLAAFALTIVLQLAIVYLPALHPVFQTAALPLPLLLLVVVCSILPVLAINLLNLGRRQRPAA